MKISPDDISYSNPSHQSKMMKQLKDMRQRYYVGKNLEVMVYWQGTWKEYKEVSKRDSRLLWDI